MKCKFEQDECCRKRGSPRYACKCDPSSCNNMVPFTNRDRLRRMNDAELAYWLSYYAHDGYMNPSCGWYEWLCQPSGD